MIKKIDIRFCRVSANVLKYLQVSLQVYFYKRMYIYRCVCVYVNIPVYTYNHALCLILPVSTPNVHLVRCMLMFCRQMRPSNGRITSMAACQGPKRQKTAPLAQQEGQVRRQDLPRSQEN